MTGVAALVLGFLPCATAINQPKAKGWRSGFHLFARGIREVVADKRVLVTSAMEGIQNMSMGALEAFLPVYAVTVAGLNVFEAGLLWGVQIVVTFIAKPLMGRVSDRWGRRPLIVAGMFLCAVPMAIIPQLTGFVPLMIAGAFFGLGEAFVTSSSAAMVADYCQARHYGAAMGTFGTIFRYRPCLRPDCHRSPGGLSGLWSGLYHRCGPAGGLSPHVSRHGSGRTGNGNV